MKKGLTRQGVRDLGNHGGRVKSPEERSAERERACFHDWQHKPWCDCGDYLNERAPCHGEHCRRCGADRR
mgnify:CR=1 FL=1